VVAFPREGEVLVGDAARDRLHTDPTHTVSAIKRLLGRSVGDDDVANHLARAAYHVQAGPDQSATFMMWGQRYAVPQLCSFLFAYAKLSAEGALGCAVERAVVSVPVSFSETQIELLKRAAKLGGLDVIDVIEEPTAAAVANMTHDDFGGVIGVYDFGGGTFDFSVVDAEKGEFSVMATAGDSWLGGDDLDLGLADAIANLLWRKHEVDLRHRAVEWQFLLSSCERAKRGLASGSSTQIVVPEVMRTMQGALDLRYNLKRSQAETLWRPFVKRTLATCRQSLSLVGLAPEQLSAIYLSGGTTHLPLIQRALRGFGVPIRSAVAPDAAVCIGSGIRAAQLERRFAAR